MLPVRLLVGVHGRRAGRPARRGPDGPNHRAAWDHDALEHAIVLCLVSFARLVSASGDADRLARLCAALEPFGIYLRNCGIEPTTIGKDAGDVKPRTPISGREQQVASLIAEGMTNREIAEALVISERTADTHVQNILAKLGLVSRAQVAAWYVEQSGAPGAPANLSAARSRQRYTFTRPSSHR